MSVFRGHFGNPKRRSASASLRVNMILRRIFPIDLMRNTSSFALYRASIFHSPVWSRPPMMPLQKEGGEPKLHVGMVSQIGKNTLLSIPGSHGKAGVFDQSTKLFGIIENGLPE